MPDEAGFNALTGKDIALKEEFKELKAKTGH